MDHVKPTECDKECLETNNKLSTLSTSKCSTDQLICKSPLDSPAGATASPRSISDQFIERNNVSNNAALAFALLQIALGIIISVCGFFIYTHNMASGLWTGPIVITTGILGTIVQYRSSDSTQRHLLHTWYLILGLVSFALSQLSLVLTVIGLTRLETNLMTGASVGVSVMIPQPIDDFLKLTVEMERALAEGLLITVMVATGFECVVAATGVYLQARDSLKLWCCASAEKKLDTSLLGTADVIGKDTMLRSWLGKLQSPPLTGTVRTNPTTVYMVPTTLPHFKRVNGKQINKPYIRTVLPSAMVPALVPVHVMMQQPQQLVPILPATPPSYCPQSIPPQYHPYAAYATLRPPPPPALMVGRPATINYHHPVQMVQRRHTTAANNSTGNRKHHQRVIKEQRQQQVDMVYTGLDRDIAEQYIECCDSRKSTITSKSTVESAQER